jgi:hypothetical protein
MKGKQHSPEQIIRKLRTAEQILNQGQSVDDVCRVLEFSADLSRLATAAENDAATSRRAAFGLVVACQSQLETSRRTYLWVPVDHFS